MKKETIITVFATIIGIFVILLIVGSAFPEERSIKIPVEKNYMEEFKINFISGCMESGDAIYSQCVCAYNNLYYEYGEDGLLDLSIKYLKTEKMPERAVNAVIECFE